MQHPLFCQGNRLSSSPRQPRPINSTKTLDPNGVGARRRQAPRIIELYQIFSFIVNYGTIRMELWIGCEPLVWKIRDVHRGKRQKSVGDDQGRQSRAARSARPGRHWRKYGLANRKRTLDPNVVGATRRGARPGRPGGKNSRPAVEELRACFT